MTPPPVEEYKPFIFNKIGATLLNISKPDYSVYQHRLQDVNAHLRLWQTAIDSQCTTDTNRYVKLISDKWNITRGLRLDNQRLTIDTYDKNRYSQLSMHCRTLAKKAV